MEAPVHLMLGPDPGYKCGTFAVIHASETTERLASPDLLLERLKTLILKGILPQPLEEESSL
jgi:hypothetical protein